SLKVGTTTEISGKAMACEVISGPGLTASFMRQSYSGRPPCCQSAVPRKDTENARKTGENRPAAAHWNAIWPISKTLHISDTQPTTQTRDSSAKTAECRLDSNCGGMRK